MRVDRILAIILIAACFLVAIGSWSVRPKSSGIDLTASKGAFRGGGAAQIAVFNLNGTITNGSDDGGGFGGEKGITATRIVPLLREAENDHVKAILLKINSPGGTAAASQAIYDELMRIRKGGKIKIVASFGDVAASGGYYIASAADHIVCLPSTTTGSIGVIAHLPNVTGLMEKVGYKEIVFKSGPHKDIMSPFRQVDPEERAIIQSIIDDTYQQFLEAVSAGRPKLTIPKLKPIADGRIYTGRQALKVGLVDSLGTARDAVKKAADLAGIKGEPETRDYTEHSVFDYLLRMQSKFAGQLTVEVGTGALISRFPARVPLALME